MSLIVTEITDEQVMLCYCPALLDTLKLVPFLPFFLTGSDEGEVGPGQQFSASFLATSVFCRPEMQKASEGLLWWTVRALISSFLEGSDGVEWGRG